MCLYVDTNMTKRAQKRKGTVIRYKVLKTNVSTHYNRDGSYTDRHGLYSPIWGKTWQSGFNRCDLRRKPKDIKEGRVNNGIHVYKTKQHAIDEWKVNGNRFYLVIVPVKCHVDDLMGVDSYEEAYFKVFLEKKDYEKARAKDKSVLIEQGYTVH